jgi:predicted acetyltransferase
MNIRFIKARKMTNELSSFIYSSGIAYSRHYHFTEGYNVYVVKLGKKVIGFSYIYEDDEYQKSFYLAEIEIHEKYREQGVGKQFVDYIKERHPRIILDAITSVKKFWIKCGFRTTGRVYSDLVPMVTKRIKK